MKRVFSVTKTRWLFLGFFLALAIPASILTYQSYEQLNWQTKAQFKQDVNLLVEQINKSLQQIIVKEEARPDTDYTFFVLAGAPEARFVQRSDLSKYPVDSNFSGIIGYFQINEKGQYTSPILPSAHVQSEVQPQLYGISPEENQKRDLLEKQILTTLLDNQWASRTQEEGKIISDLSETSFLDSKLEDRGDKRQGTSFEFQKAIEAERALKLDKQMKAKKRSAKSRMERNYSPQQSLVSEAKENRRIEQDKIKISLFESEIESFRFDLLEDGNFVAYRLVWRDGEKLIQGALLSGKEFIEQSVLKKFNMSSLAGVMELDIYYANKKISSTVAGYRQNLRGVNNDSFVLVDLLEPLNQIGLSFQLGNMPASAGQTFILSIATSLLFVLILGTYFLYRVAVKQSNLVQQQQDFVSSVSHELKTPLTSIRMYGEILKQGWLDDEKRDEYYDYIYSESERLSRLIANVLQISKVNHNALELNIAPIQISELASLINSKVDSQIAQSEFELKLHIPSELKNRYIMVDTDAFVQIVINLVDNAVKYAAKAKQKRIDISFQSGSQSSIEVSVRDYGPGVSSRHLKRIFDIFYRSGNELTRETPGTGIGLALVKELVIAMDGKIEAKNHSKGIEFIIRFSYQNQ